MLCLCVCVCVCVGWVQYLVLAHGVLTGQGTVCCLGPTRARWGGGGGRVTVSLVVSTILEAVGGGGVPFPGVHASIYTLPWVGAWWGGGVVGVGTSQGP